MAGPPANPRLIHGDLGPAHIRVVGDQVAGVIDWGDCGVGDPALDLSWVLYGAKSPFARAARAAYAPDNAVVSRARDWHLVGPWHEVLFGLDTDQPAYVKSGLAGVVTRLRT
jgi:aminoglycoside phosphotransferase (APT) family kinase protein